MNGTKQNLHTHTTFADGKNTPEELAQEAVRRGFSGLGFSEHTYMPFSPYPYQMKVRDMDEYRLRVYDLKERYRGVLDVFCGLEWEFYSDVPAEGYDYLIGSVHYLSVDGGLYGFDHNLEKTQEYIQQHFAGNAMAFAKSYFDTVARLPQRGKFDILGHFDLLTKNNEAGNFLDTTSKEYLSLGYEAIHALKGKIPLFEVNTGAMARGYRSSPYPQMDFLREFLCCGYGAVITSDCHDAGQLDCGFDLAEDLLRQAGFRSKWILTEQGFREVAL